MISLRGTIKAIIVSHSNLLDLIIQQEDGQQKAVFFNQFVPLISHSLKKGDAIIVNCEVMANYELRGLTLEFLEYQPKDQHQVATLPEKLVASYRKMMLMEKILMQAGQFFKKAGDHKNARYYLGRSISLRLEMPSLLQILETCQQQ